ncbi:tRNA(Ile)-lysidine synthase [Filomicrobium insigne]|uniref:tRNA(Ile)-lysidine synthase n=1 Tax=Filomicrobium insigne TaxID=418854 RepID=A0A1H0LN19_9HYPH|nr:tRNA lysidine(34) synthetase TilS [Filomicrobium insigne]SDO69544.1 tRNA(Ile)-lysidine synthase [Filomicrobium insigne]
MTANGNDDAPISDREIALLLASLSGFSLLVLAVSGGSDSMALMHLVSRWRGTLEEGQRPEVLVATVDHGLRPESRHEAEVVGQVSAQLGFGHVILTWDGKKPVSGVQAAAREERYRLLMGLLAERSRLQMRHRAEGEGARAALVTAHTQDDQAETLLMRLARGSGIQGLSGIMPMTERDDGIWLVRPLLEVPKARLKATLEADGQTWIEDPSNDDVRFERVRLREAREMLASLGLTSRALGRSARRLQRVQALVAEAAGQWIEANANFNEGAYATVKLAAFSDAGEVAVRGLQAILSRMGGDASDPELSQIETLVDSLADTAAANAEMASTTLGGCIIEVARQRGANEPVVRIFREAGSYGLPIRYLHAGESEIWDRRFRLTASPDLSDPIYVAALGADGWAQLKRERPDLADFGLPARAAATLPALWLEARLVAVPYLGALDVNLSGEGRLTEAAFLGVEVSGGKPRVAT